MSGVDTDKGFVWLRCSVNVLLQRRVSTYVWLVLGYPVLALFHSLGWLLSWFLVFTIPVAKMNARAMGSILLLPPEDVYIGLITEEVFLSKHWRSNIKGEIWCESVYSTVVNVCLWSVCAG